MLAHDGVHHCQAIVFKVLLRCVLGTKSEWGECMLGFVNAVCNECEAVDSFLADDPCVWNWENGAELIQLDQRGMAVGTGAGGGCGTRISVKSRSTGLR